MSTSKTQRIISFVLAILFAGSTVGAVAYYVIINKEQQKEQEALMAMQEDLYQQNQQQLQQEQPQTDNKLKGTKLQSYEPVASIASLQTIDIIPGSGDTVEPNDTVTVHYTGALASDGTIFESSLDSGSTATFGLNQVIAGWTQGLPGMKTGGTRRLLIPSSLAYGATPPQGSNIPANADLVFDVQLVKIN